MGINQIDKMFDPRSVAVFGASDTSDSVGARVFANLLAGGFDGAIFPINPKHEKVAGRRCFHSLAEVGHTVDLAIVATPANTVHSIIEQCASASTRNAIVLTTGFGEGGEDANQLSSQLVNKARRFGIRFIGPNCVGVVRPSLGLNATILGSKTLPGRLALVSQSGALCSAISDWAEPHHLGFSTIVSLGNALDVDFGDVVDFLANDPKTSAILLYVECVGDAKAFISALRRAAQAKPIVVLKAGRNKQSSQAAHAHTGALPGGDDVFDAALSRAGAVRVHSFAQLFAAAEVLSSGKHCRGNRLGIITNGGGAGVLAADRAGDLDIDLPVPSEKTIASLDKSLPAFWSRANPIDILGNAYAEQYANAVNLALEDDAYDGVLVMLTPQAKTDATATARKVVEAIPKSNTKPLLACWMGETAVAPGRNFLSKNGVPEFTTPEQAVEAFSYLARYDQNRRLSLETPGPIAESEANDIHGARMIVEAALAEGRSMLSDIESKAVLRAFDIPINITIAADDANEALVAAEMVGFPVAMKIRSSQIIQKTDVGGVRTGIMNAADAKLAFRSIVENARAARPEAEIRGVTVEQMVAGADALEVILGVSRDPIFGPFIFFGVDGQMFDFEGDRAVSLPPLNEVLARRMIESTRISRLLDTFREMHLIDRAAIVDVLLRVSDLVCELPSITRLEINPLFAKPEGVIAVDARITVERPPAKDGPYDHVAIHPYPRHLIEKQHLQDGTTLTIRPIRPEDAMGEATFVRELSMEAKRFRFMGAISELPREMLVRFTQLDYRREMALVAIIDQSSGPKQVGVARYVINPDNTSCEFAIVVSDKIQQQGIGTRLMKALMASARDHDLERIEGTVFRNNTPMLLMMKQLGFTQGAVAEDPAVVAVHRVL